MTISLTVQELKDFEANFSQWSERRSIVVIDIFLKLQQQPYGVSQNTVELGKYLRKCLDEWDELNPAPKLIPNV